MSASSPKDWRIMLITGMPICVTAIEKINPKMLPAITAWKARTDAYTNIIRSPLNISSKMTQALTRFEKINALVIQNIPIEASQAIAAPA